jgi:hypothetical protein
MHKQRRPVYQPPEKPRLDGNGNPLLGEAGVHPRKPHGPRAGEHFRLHGSDVVYVRTEAGELRRVTKKAKGKAARRADKAARRQGRGPCA